VGSVAAPEISPREVGIVPSPADDDWREVSRELRQRAPFDDAVRALALCAPWTAPQRRSPALERSCYHRRAAAMKAPIIRTKFAPKRGELEISYRPWGSPRFGSLPVVAVHGDWMTSASWTLLASELTECWVLAPDLRGRGKTRGPDHGYTIAELAADLAVFLDLMELPRAHLVGHGLGAAVVTELALDAPRCAVSLSLISPPNVDGTAAGLLDPEAPKAYKDSPRAFADALDELAPNAPRDMLWVGLIESGHKQRLSAAEANLAALASWRPGDALAKLDMPRAVFVGERDPCPGALAAANRAAKALGCSCETLADSAHYPHLEQPQALAERMRKVFGL